MTRGPSGVQMLDVLTQKGNAAIYSLISDNYEVEEIENPLLPLSLSSWHN